MKTVTKRPVVIGLDFDGVICDTGKIHAQKYAEFIIVAKGDEKLCGEMLHEEYCRHPEYTINARPLDGAIKYIGVLLSSGHRVRVVTARSDSTLNSAWLWLRKHRLSLDIVGVGGKSKAEETKDCEVFLDDFLSVLHQLPHVSHRFLFSRKYNRHDILPGNIRRVDSWFRFHQYINRLA